MRQEEWDAVLEFLRGRRRPRPSGQLFPRSRNDGIAIRGDELVQHHILISVCRNPFAKSGPVRSYLVSPTLGDAACTIRNTAVLGSTLKKEPFRKRQEDHSRCDASSETTIAHVPLGGCTESSREADTRRDSAAADVRRHHERGRTASHGHRHSVHPEGADTRALPQTPPTAARFSTSAMEPRALTYRLEPTGEFTIGQHGLPTWDILAPTSSSRVRRAGE